VDLRRGAPTGGGGGGGLACNADEISGLAIGIGGILLCLLPAPGVVGDVGDVGLLPKYDVRLLPGDPPFSPGSGLPEFGRATPARSGGWGARVSGPESVGVLIDCPLVYRDISSSDSDPALGERGLVGVSGGSGRAK
jgi:hypothetical protein